MTNDLSCLQVGLGGNVAQLERWTDTPLKQDGFTDAARDFSPCQLSVQTLLWCPYSPRVQLHALTSVRTLKIPSIGSLPLFGHTKIPHALSGMGGAALAAAAALPT